LYDFNRLIFKTFSIQLPFSFAGLSLIFGYASLGKAKYHLIFIFRHGIAFYFFIFLVLLIFSMIHRFIRFYIALLRFARPCSSLLKSSFVDIPIVSLTLACVNWEMNLIDVIDF
jgi:hypothetical protein